MEKTEFVIKATLERLRSRDLPPSGALVDYVMKVADYMERLDLFDQPKQQAGFTSENS